MSEARIGSLASHHGLGRCCLCFVRAACPRSSNVMHGHGTVGFEVVARLRPLSDKERDLGTRSVTKVQGNQVFVEVDAGESKDAEFVFDRCFGPPSPQSTVHGQAQPPLSVLEARSQEQFFIEVGVQLAEFALCSYDACFIAYGQRGAGKTHAVLGTSSTPGLLPRIAEHVLGQQLPGLSIFLSVLEIGFADELRDLLLPLPIPSATGGTADSSGYPSGSGVAPTSSGSCLASQKRQRQVPLAPLAVVEHPAVGVCVAGLTEVQCTTLKGLCELLDHCARERAVSASSLGGPSRSHVVFCLRLQRDVPSQQGGAEAGPQGAVGARITLVDLAGGEVAPDRPSPAAAAARESLLALYHAVSLLSGEKSRSTTAGSLAAFSCSKLTQLLKGAFLGSARSTLLAAISPSLADREVTLQTLEFSARVGRIPAMQQRRRGMPQSAIVPLIQEEVRLLRQQLSAAGPSPCLAEAVANWEEVLAQQTQASNDVDMLEVSCAVKEAFVATHCQRGLALDAAFTTGLPFLANLSSDPHLRGRLICPLRRPPAGTVVVGASKDCNLVLQGVGIPPRLCELRVGPGDEVTLTLLPSWSRQQTARCAVNGQVVRRGADVRLEHGDRILFGWSHAFQLNAASRAERLGLAATLPASSDVDAFNELAPDDSDAYCELSLYIEDIREKMSDEGAHEFLDLLRPACHLVDEANEITREMRPDVDVKFDVDFVWDIFRRAEDVLIIRIQQFSAAGGPGGEPKVSSYWTYPRFCERLVEMRCCYDTFVRHKKPGKKWEHTNHPLKDPWFDASLASSRHQAQLETATVVGSASISGVARDWLGQRSTGRSSECETSSQSIGGTSAGGARAQRCNWPVSTGRLQQNISPQPRARSAALASGSGRACGGGNVRGSRPSSPSAIGKGRATTPDETAQELERLRKETARQGAELRKSKAELLQAERERRFHAEMIDSLRSQLADKDELVAALRVLVQDRNAERVRLVGELTKESHQSKSDPSDHVVKLRDEDWEDKASFTTLPRWDSRTSFAIPHPEDHSHHLVHPETVSTAAPSLGSTVSGSGENGTKPLATGAASPDSTANSSQPKGTRYTSPPPQQVNASLRTLGTSVSSRAGSPQQASVAATNGACTAVSTADAVASTEAAGQHAATSGAHPQLGPGQVFCKGASSHLAPQFASSFGDQTTLRLPGSVILQPPASTLTPSAGKQRVVTWTNAMAGHVCGGDLHGSVSLPLSSGAVPAGGYACSVPLIASSSVAPAARHRSVSPQHVRPCGNIGIAGGQSMAAPQLRLLAPTPLTSPRLSETRHASQDKVLSCGAQRVTWSTTPRTPQRPSTPGNDSSCL